MINTKSHCFVLISAGILSHEEEDIESDTGISSDFTCSTETEINIYVNPHERQYEAQKEVKETFKNKRDDVKSSIFEYLRNINFTC